MAGFLSSLIPSYFHWWHIPIVFLAGMVGEGYAVVIGSGGILIQFALASLGMPLPSVIATDLAGCFGANAGVLTAYPRSIWENKRLLITLGTPFFLGGIIGTIFLTRISPVLLQYLLIIALAAILAYMLLARKKETRSSRHVQIRTAHYPVIGSAFFGLGVYTNVSGIGYGTFLKIILNGLMGIDANESIGISNIIDLPLLVFSFIVTAIAGLIAWPYLITLWISTYIGANYVARYIQKVPEAALRKMLVIIASIYLFYLIWSIVK